MAQDIMSKLSSKTSFGSSKIGTVPSNILLPLIIGSFTGGYFGAHLSKLNGNILIKKTFTTVCILVGISLLIKSIKSFFIK